MPKVCVVTAATADVVIVVVVVIADLKVAYVCLYAQFLLNLNYFLWTLTFFMDRTARTHYNA